MPRRFVKRGPLSEATKEKIRQSQLGKRLSPETRAKMSAAHKGKNTGPHPYTSESNRNRVWTAEARAKVSARCKGKPLSDQTRAKMGAVRKGVGKSQATRQRMSDSQKDPTTPANRSRRAALSASNARRSILGLDCHVKGYYSSPKCSTPKVAYRSVSIELRLMQQFDADPKVKVWESPLAVTYLDHNGVRRHTLPDFLVTFTDGSRRVVEGKGPHLLAKYLQDPKFTAVKNWCRDNRAGFSIVTTTNRCSDLEWLEVV